MVASTAIPGGKHMWTSIANDRTAQLASASFLALAALSTSALAAPPIRTSASNQVPACVSPSRLMDFLKAQNPKADPMYDGIAKLYKEHGEKYGVRWDYAFFQMSIETGYLAFRRPGGKAGDVKVRQYNFAGIGTTGGGVPGDAYPDMSTGVLAQIQHLVAYSGEPVAAPVAPRTKLMQDNIIEVSKRLKRQVTFADLSGRWAADKRYGAIIDKIAERFREDHCKGPAPTEARIEAAKAAPTAAAARPIIAMTKADVSPAPVMPVAAAQKPEAKPEIRQSSVKVAALEAEPARPVLLTGPAPAQRPRTRVQSSDPTPAVADAVPAAATTQRIAAFAPRQLPESFGSRASLGAGGVVPPAPRDCKIATASFGGTKTLLLKSASADATTYTLLQVVDGFEATMRDKFTATRAPGAEMLGEFASQDVAMVTAKALCAKSG
jgi:Mannosyl-glycoprotein endo-beta-N-acetylglucosaminidase